jgi:hypothetical protein
MEENEPGLGWESVERVAQHTSRMSGCSCSPSLLIPSSQELEFFERNPTGAIEISESVLQRRLLGFYTHRPLL